MPNQTATQHVLKKDKYVNARGGNSNFLDLYCSKCKQHILLYQKDGHGHLLRLYLDRIFEPPPIACLYRKITSKAKMPNLKCLNCNTLIGTPMVYEPENRLAFRLIYGTFIKRKSTGIYPVVDSEERLGISGKEEINEK